MTFDVHTSIKNVVEAACGFFFSSSDLSGPNVTVTRLILLCEDAPDPVTMDLTGTPFLFMSGAINVTTVANFVLIGLLVRHFHPNKLNLMCVCLVR